MNGSIALGGSSRFLIVGVALAFFGVLGSFGQSALARDLGAGLSRSAEGLERMDGEASVDDPFSISIADPPRSSREVVVAQNTASDPAVARMEVRLSELERDLRESTGKVEDLSHQVRQLRDRLEKLSSDVDYRLGQPPGAAAPGSVAAAAPSEALPPSSGGNAPPVGRAPETGAAPGEGPTVLGRLPASEAGTAPPRPSAPEPEPPVASSTQTAAVPSTATPREQYAYGFGLLRKAEYDGAEVAFKEFLSKYPDDPLADNARYWLGETYYARGDYAPAAETFLDAYQMNKTGPKAPDALLKLGMSLGNLKKIPEACATYDQLKTALPDAPVSIKTKAQNERRSLGCK